MESQKSQKTFGITLTGEVYDYIFIFKKQLEAQIGIALPVTKVVEKIILDHQKSSK